MSLSRRDFIKQATAAAALGVVSPLSGRSIWQETEPDLLPEANEDLLREIAAAAVSAASSAGAAFADVRVTAVRQFTFRALFNRAFQVRPRIPLPPNLTLRADFGVRVLVDGVWGQAGSYVLTPAAAAAAAKVAVERARVYQQVRKRTIELAETPRIDGGRWSTPIEANPFAVPAGDQADLVLTALAAAEGVPGVRSGTIDVGWSQTLQVFASSEGSVSVQRFWSASPAASVTGRARDDHGEGAATVHGLRQGGYGFEAFTHEGFDIVVGMRDAAERAVAASAPPGPAPVPVDVGRYDLILSANAVSTLFLTTLAPALNSELALGYHANRAGTSFAAPPDQVMGRLEVASPAVSVEADRVRPHANGTVGWDDEGVPSGSYTLIRDGVLVDFLTSRQTAVELADAYRDRGDAVRSHGCVVGRGQMVPVVNAPNLVLKPGAGNASLDDLIADTRRGYYVDTAGGGTDQQMLSGQYVGSGVREIRDGKVGRPVTSFGFQFMTPQLWRSVDAVGGNDSVEDVMFTWFNMLAVPVRFRQINVLNTGIVL